MEMDEIGNVAVADKHSKFEVAASGPPPYRTIFEASEIGLMTLF